MTQILHKELSYQTVGAALEVHRVLGSGFLETVYEQALAHELALEGDSFQAAGFSPGDVQGDRSRGLSRGLRDRRQDYP